MTVDRPSPLNAGVRFVFLDRDGVVNRKLPEGRYVTRREEFELLPGAAEAIAELNRSGKTVILITNQRGIALGVMTEADLGDIHRGMREELASSGAAIDAIYYCPHGRDACDCRKPATGMVEAAFRDFPEATAESSMLIGDSLSDIECGHRAGIGTIFIQNDHALLTQEAGDTGHREAGAARAREIAGRVAGSLAEAVQFILK
jgi:D-glycero-D-manno-heptose 1,7-bisphosphate phosphatase